MIPFFSPSLRQATERATILAERRRARAGPLVSIASGARLRRCAHGCDWPPHTERDGNSVTCQAYIWY